MPDPSVTRNVTFVVKTSKLCNLRCRYCYELEELGLRHRMSREQLRRMYKHIADYYAEADARDGERTGVILCWHGGEPLLIEPDFYWQTFADQQEFFGGRVNVLNQVQTNLVTLDDERIRLLRDGFDGVGVSIDLFGDLRVNIAGRDLQGTVLANMDRLRAEGVALGAITVLHRGNLHQLDRIWRFYEQAGISFRVLPLFDGASAQQNTRFELTAQEINDALRRLADLWLASERPVPVAPVTEHIKSLIRYLEPDPEVRTYYDKSTWCAVLLVNTNGDCFTVGDPYGEPDWVLGNLFTTPLGEIFAGEPFARSVRETERRIAANCLQCPFFGGCDGRRVGDERFSIYEYQDDLAVCTLDRAVLTHLERRFREGGLIDGNGRLAVAVPDDSPQPEFAG
jgi:uncharacterized protein